MIITNIINVRVATLCCNAATSNHVEVYKNNVVSAITQFVYTPIGSVSFVIGDDTVHVGEGQIVDFSQYMGQEFAATASSTGAFCISINPIGNNVLDLVNFNHGNYTVNPLAETQYLVCLKGTIVSGTSTIKEFMFAKLPSNRDTYFSVG